MGEQTYSRTANVDLDIQTLLAPEIKALTFGVAIT